MTTSANHSCDNISDECMTLPALLRCAIEFAIQLTLAIVLVVLSEVSIFGLVLDKPICYGMAIGLLVGAHGDYRRIAPAFKKSKLQVRLM